MDMRFGFSRSVVAVSCAVLLVGGVGCANMDSTSSDPSGANQLQTFVQLTTLSNRADMISGGDALVEATLLRGISPSKLSILVDGRDVTSEFAVRANGRIIGLIRGLAEGPNQVIAALGRQPAARLIITNHKIGGPIFTGPQITPWVCATPTARPESGDTPRSNASGLSTQAIDEQCNIATEVKLFYRTTRPLGNGQGGTCVNARPDPPPTPTTETCFKPFTPSVPAADVAMTTTDAGVTMPYIVRVERGTLNRGIYDIAVLFNPTLDDPALGWRPTAPQPGWNGKVLYQFGASTGQPRLQSRSSQNWNEDTALSRGFLVADNSMTDSALNSNRTTMTETLMMMKEKIIDSYGPIRYMMGAGCSGGSINQLTAASIFPGLLDGIQPTCTYPDSETTSLEVVDCTLLVNAYVSPRWAALQAGVPQAQINAKKAAINGHVDQTGCHAWVNLFSNVGRPGVFRPIVVLNDSGVIGPNPGVPNPINNCLLPNSMVYDPVTNPNGLRCSGADHAVSIWGKVPNTNRARTPTDNVGVQYGLKALNSGAISAEEFVTLNEIVGGFDFDSNVAPARSVGDPEALAIAYRAGIVSDAKQLAKTPMIDLRGWDDAGPAAIHHVWRSFSLRARIDAVSDNAHRNHVMWRYGTGLIAPAASGLTLQSFLTMDRWLLAVKANTTDATIEEKVANSRPVDAFDFCYLTSDTTFSTKVTDPAVCDADIRLRPHASPRQVAGGPVAENIFKCQLKPIDPADYAPAALSAEQLARLAAVFPDGVCDFSKPGVGQQPAVSPLSFAAGPGGVPFGPPPTTTPPIITRP